MSCVICCDMYTGVLRKPLTCASCDFEACAVCVQKYLLEVNRADCMACHADKDDDYIRMTFPAAWVNGPFKAHRERILVDLEIARLPASQHLVANYKLTQSLREEVRVISEERKQLKRRVHEIWENSETAKLRLERMRANKYTTDGRFPNLGDNEGWDPDARECTVKGCLGTVVFPDYSISSRCDACEADICRNCKCAFTGDHTAHVCVSERVTDSRYHEHYKRCPKCTKSTRKTPRQDQVEGIPACPR